MCSPSPALWINLRPVYRRAMGAWSWKRALLHAALAFIVAVVIGAPAFAAFGSADSTARLAAPLTAAERAPLVEVDEGGQRRLRHPAFGFSLLHPGSGFREAPEV